MPAKLCLHRFSGKTANRHGKSGCFGWYHLTPGESAKVTAIGTVLSILLCQRGKIAAIIEFGDDLMRRFLCFNQNMGCSHLFA